MIDTKDTALENGPHFFHRGFTPQAENSARVSVEAKTVYDVLSSLSHPTLALHSSGRGGPTILFGRALDFAQVFHFLIAQEAADVFEVLADSLVTELKHFRGQTV